MSCTKNIYKLFLKVIVNWITNATERPANGSVKHAVGNVSLTNSHTRTVHQILEETSCISITIGAFFDYYNRDSVEIDAAIQAITNQGVTMKRI